MIKIKPTRALIELTARCNFDCRYCPREWLADYRKKDMSMHTFRYVIDHLPKSVKWVHPQGYGEPLLYPQFIEACKYIKESGRKIKFFTNASLLTTSMCKEMIEIGVDNIVFSVDDISVSKTQLSRPDVSNTTKWNIIGACQIFENTRVKTTVRICKTKDNKDRITEIKMFWTQYADVVAVSPEFDAFTPEMCGFTEWQLSKKKWRTKPCEQIMTQIVVRQDGTIPLCCNDWLNFYPCGHISWLENDETFTEVFNNDKFKQVRKMLRSGRTAASICAHMYCSRF